MKQYTPKTHEIRAAVINYRADLIEKRDRVKRETAERRSEEELDRWFDSMLPGVNEKGWDQPCLREGPAHAFEPIRSGLQFRGDATPIIAICRQCGVLR